MGSSLSSIIANVVMEEIEQTALNTYLKSPSLWVLCVDSVYAMTKNSEVKSLNNILITCNYCININKVYKRIGKIRTIIPLNT